MEIKDMALRDMSESQIAGYLEVLGRAISNMMPAGSARHGRAPFFILVWDEPGQMRFCSNLPNYDRILPRLKEAVFRIEGGDVFNEVKPST